MADLAGGNIVYFILRDVGSRRDSDRKRIAEVGERGMKGKPPIPLFQTPRRPPPRRSKL
jgi:hypothetical protein